MAYLTNYELEIIEGEDLIEKVIKKESEEYFELAYSIDESGYTKESSKWYEHESDLKAISKKYPNSIFSLSGESEDSEEIWVKIFKNGKMTKEEN